MPSVSRKPKQKWLTCIGNVLDKVQQEQSFSNIKKTLKVAALKFEKLYKSEAIVNIVIKQWQHRWIMNLKSLNILECTEAHKTLKKITTNMVTRLPPKNCLFPYLNVIKNI